MMLARLHPLLIIGRSSKGVERRQIAPMQFRLRTLLIAVTVIGGLCGVVHWWKTPYVQHRRSLNGEFTEEVFWRRELPYALIQTGLVQCYSNGKKAAEFRYQEFHPGDSGFRPLEGYPRYWLDDGTEVSREQFDLRQHE